MAWGEGAEVTTGGVDEVGNPIPVMPVGWNPEVGMTAAQPAPPKAPVIPKGYTQAGYYSQDASDPYGHMLVTGPDGQAYMFNGNTGQIGGVYGDAAAAQKATAASKQAQDIAYQQHIAASDKWYKDPTTLAMIAGGTLLTAGALNGVLPGMAGAPAGGSGLLGGGAGAAGGVTEAEMASALAAASAGEGAAGVGAGLNATIGGASGLGMTAAEAAALGLGADSVASGLGSAAGGAGGLAKAASGLKDLLPSGSTIKDLAKGAALAGGIGSIAADLVPTVPKASTPGAAEVSHPDWKPVAKSSSPKAREFSMADALRTRLKGTPQEYTPNVAEMGVGTLDTPGVAWDSQYSMPMTLAQQLRRRQ
jgi:hypothetical protein